MCHYCGCREMPLIRDYIAEHERATNLGGDAVRAIDRGDLAEASALLSAMGTELRSHWQGEENGLFAVMGRDPMVAEHIGPLVQEHRELEDLLATVDLSDPADQERIRTRRLRAARAHRQGGGRPLPRVTHRLGRRRVGRLDAGLARQHTPAKTMIGE